MLASVGIGLAGPVFAAPTAPAAVAVPMVAGNPGVPGVPVVLFHEDFENGLADGELTPLVDYVGASGDTYTAEGAWADPAFCSGFILDGTTPDGAMAALGCTSGPGGLRGLATQLGTYNGTDPAAQGVDPDTGEPCDTVVTPLAAVNVAKSSNPASGTTVKDGEKIEYTLTFTNDGIATGTVDVVDRLANVLDDARLSGEPVVSPEGALTATVGEGSIAITGQLPVGETVTVTYGVTVLPDGQRGDNAIGNLVAWSDDEDPECGTGGAVCTDHPVSQPVAPALAATGGEMPLVAGLAALLALLIGGALVLARRHRTTD